MMKSSIPNPEDLDDEVETEESPKRSTPMVQWLIVLSLAILLVPLYAISLTIKQDTAPLQTQAADIDSTLSVTSGPNPTEKALKGTLTQLQKQANALDAANPTLGANRLDWPVVMAVVGSYNQTQVVLLGIAQTDRVITVQGQANDESAVMDYVQRLKDSNLFNRVVLQGIAIKPSPTITPSTTPTPTPTPTPTVIPGTKTSASTPATRIQPPTLTPTPVVYDDLSSKFAGFTILLEAKAIIAPTPTHS